MGTNKKSQFSCLCFLKAAGNDFGPAGPRYGRNASDPRDNLLKHMDDGTACFVICGAGRWRARRGTGPVHIPDYALIVQPV